MADKDAEQVKKTDVPQDAQNELLHDYEGNLYLVNNEHLEAELRRREVSPEKEIDLQLARDMLNSNLRQLTDRQRDVMYYIMQEWSQEKIAEKLGITQAVVAEHLAAARKKLGQLITQTKEVIQEETENE